MATAPNKVKPIKLKIKQFVLIDLKTKRHNLFKRLGLQLILIKDFMSKISLHLLYTRKC